MGAVWSKVGDEIEKHSHRNPMLSAAIRIQFAVSFGADVKSCGIYRRDPAKHPDERNILPAQIEKAARRKKRARK
jgi:hypothetical protein